tara:strand:+ start:14543 stop:15247 length:705 start_codon:yes stop_codon:yes gene_type:complete
MLDTFMLTFGEPEADENFEILKQKSPNAKRIDGIKGLLNAHKACAEESRTGYFYVVDADAVISENFQFKFEPSDRREAYPGVPETECVFTYRSHNPINDLIYGYGGVKLFPKANLLKVKEFKVDMTTSIGAKFVPKFEISNTTAFNTDPFNTWRSAFRECTKLASNIIDHNKQVDDAYRLEVWCTRGDNRRFGEYALLGAQQGKDFGLHYKDNRNALNKINDWEWLEKTFNESI